MTTENNARYHAAETLGALAQRREHLSMQLAEIDRTIQVIKATFDLNFDDSSIVRQPAPDMVEVTVRDSAIRVLRLHPEGMTNDKLYQAVTDIGGKSNHPNSMRATLAKYDNFRRDEKGRWFLITD